MLQICENIRLARLSKNLSQADLAEKLDIKRSTYQNWEKNTEPDIATLNQIAQILGIQTLELLRGAVVFSDTALTLREDDPSYRSRVSVDPDMVMVLQKELEAMQTSLERLTTIAARLGASRPEVDGPVQDLGLDKKLDSTSLNKSASKKHT